MLWLSMDLGWNLEKENKQIILFESKNNSLTDMDLGFQHGKVDIFKFYPT